MARARRTTRKRKAKASCASKATCTCAKCRASARPRMPWETQAEAPKPRRRRKRRKAKARPVHHEGWSLQNILMPDYMHGNDAAHIVRTRLRADNSGMKEKGNHWHFPQWPGSQVGPRGCRSKKIGKKSAGWEATLVYCDRKRGAKTPRVAPPPVGQRWEAVDYDRKPDTKAKRVMPPRTASGQFKKTKGRA